MGAAGPASGCWTCGSATSVSRSRGRGWRRCVDALYRELEQRGIALRPHCWLSDEWFSPTQRARHRHPVLSRAPATHPARAEHDARGGGRVRAWSACASCATRRDTRCSTAIGCIAAPSYQRLFGKSSTTYPTSYRPEAGEPALTCSTCARTTRRRIRTRTSPRPSPSGCSRGRAGGKRYDGLGRAAEARVRRRADGGARAARGRR